MKQIFQLILLISQIILMNGVPIYDENSFKTIHQPVTITSNNYPNNYPNKEFYYFRIIAPYGKKINLKFIKFNVEDDPECAYDRLEIHNGHYNNKLVGTYCGDQTGHVFTSADSQLFLLFSSDREVTDSGYKIKISFVAGSSPVVPLMCGQTHLKPSNRGVEPSKYLEKRIVGGTVSQHGQWPWQVAMIFGNGQVCGGSLIHQSWVLTAAHCFEGSKVDMRASSWKSRIGEQNLLKNEGKAFDMKTENIFIHPNRSSVRHRNDIALVKLQNPVPLSNYRNTICLPKPNQEFIDGTKCSASGWGKTSNNGVSSSTLKHVTIPIISAPRCEKSMRAIGGTEIYPDYLCAGSLDGISDTCQGDSGGPLVCRTGNVYTQVGVVSFGYGCAIENTPSVYAKLSYFVPWIEKIIESNL